MSQTLIPARVSPPGRILHRELEARGWTQKDLAEIMGRPAQTISGIVKGNKQITPETAIELAEALGTSAELWTNLEAKYRLFVAKKDANGPSFDSEIARKSYLYSLAPITEMIKQGWIVATDSVIELERQLCQFFGIEDIDEPPKLAVSCRQSEDRDPEVQAQIAWVKRVENLVTQQEVATFEPKKLKAALPEILTYTSEAEALALVPKKLLSLGVHFAIVPHLKKTYLDGAAFYLENKPVVALTLRHNRIDSFWFTLLHELGHIVAQHKGSYLDNLDNLAVNQEETEANQLAADWLLDPVALEHFVEQTSPYFSAKKVQAFAGIQQRHPGIVVGRLQSEGDIPYQNLRKLLIKVDQYLELWIDRPGPPANTGISKVNRGKNSRDEPKTVIF
ncbi:HigA family addiction module antidote protein (plasmid) [Acaryochloris sp. 'Moss Beach']|uniref:HigA family addiction module antitoxin n=1 Tax=Acaryochloris sp. 'Moss Beach' TaxID=2740837 RepID=UPI001F2E5341|nr:HigA family addiction module antitoxin [Acaryochloris sp. 'Moss Beach']UJB72849.1 HigA family addiction module antidote protein [Acaryochloris sp. 'Moss Beach']